MHRLKCSLPASSLKLLYTALLLPYINYCTIAWAGGYRFCCLNPYLIYKKAIRIICGTHYFAEGLILFKSLRLLSIYDNYKLQFALPMFRHKEGRPYSSSLVLFLSVNAALHDHNTRSKELSIRSIENYFVRYFSLKI